MKHLQNDKWKDWLLNIARVSVIAILISIVVAKYRYYKYIEQQTIPHITSPNRSIERADEVLNKLGRRIDSLQDVLDKLDKRRTVQRIYISGLKNERDEKINTIDTMAYRELYKFFSER